MRLIFVRHGETILNKKRIIQGQSNAKLNKKGLMQAKLVGKRLRKEKIDFIFSSDLIRAKRTALEIARFHPNTPFNIDKLLRERGFGKYEGISIDKLKEIRLKIGAKPHLHKPVGGEDYYDVRSRISKFLKKIYPKYKDKTVLIVSHGGTNRAMLSILLKKPLKEVFFIKQDNTCVNIAELSGSFKKLKVKMHKMNCVKHL